MGLPIHRFVAATNANDVIPRFLKSGKFEPKDSVTTISNAMDVGKPNNFPRLQEMHGKEFEKIISNVTGKSYTDEETTESVNTVFEKYNYVMCPHTAIAYRGLTDYLKEENKEVTGVFLATAHPAKFLDVLDEKVAKNVIIPYNLQLVMQKKKTAIILSNEYQDLKEYLLS